MRKKPEAGYNERLFSGGIRRRLHMSRFEWLPKCLRKLNCEYQTCLELGCFDGKAIDFLPVKPIRYVGLDANWEGGLELAKAKWEKEPQYEFKQCNRPEEMQLKGETFDISICMDTLEHVPPDLVNTYLKELAKSTKKYIFVTMPNEIGIVFFFKYLYKRVFKRKFIKRKKYSLNEFINAVLGRTHKVKRSEHKGFNYKYLIKDVSKYFEFIYVSGHPLSFLPLSLNFEIVIIGKSKNCSDV